LQEEPVIHRVRTSRDGQLSDNVGSPSWYRRTPEATVPLRAVSGRRKGGCPRIPPHHGTRRAWHGLTHRRADPGRTEGTSPRDTRPCRTIKSPERSLLLVGDVLLTNTLPVYVPGATFPSALVQQFPATLAEQGSCAVDADPARTDAPPADPAMTIRSRTHSTRAAVCGPDHSARLAPHVIDTPPPPTPWASRRRRATSGPTATGDP
jgi:hypothetical protein